jgi:sigma-B regulation protein RsbU (phosphoserine phosphatase)
VGAVATMKMSKLFYKTLVIIILLFGVITTTTSGFFAWSIYQHLTEQYRSKATALAKSIADSSVETLLNSAAATLQATIDQFLDIEGVSYVFVVDAQGAIIAHTFVPRIPEKLSQLHGDTPEIAVHDIHIPGVGDFIDVSAPVLVGVAGYVHIGMNKATIRAAIRSAILGQQSLMLAIFLLSVLGAYLLVNRISQPLNQLTAYVKQLAARDFAAPGESQAAVTLLPLNSKDEIGELAASFLSLEHALQQSIENLKATTIAKERIESEIKIAREIQMSILPRTFPPFPDRPEFDIYATIEPAREVSGDFYDFFLTEDDRLCFAIGDVSGKGIPASLFMAVTRTLLKAIASRLIRPDAVLADLNKELCQGNDSAMFVTIFYGMLHLRTGEVEYSNGGHNLPYVLTREGEAKPVENTGGMALGVMEEAAYGAKKITLRAGDGLFLYTDGVTEAMDGAGTLFSDHRLWRFLQEVNGSPPRELIRRAMGAVKQFTAGAEQSDDITALALQYLRQ